MRSSALWFSTLLIVLAVGCKQPSADVPAPGTTPSAAQKTKLTKLKIIDLKVGKGRAAEDGDHLVMKYTGKLANGTVFDTTDKPGHPPFTLTLGQGMVIKGWDQGLKGMKQGGIRNLEIPSKLAYGSVDKGEIPPDSDLYFNVELVSLTKRGDENVIKVDDTVMGSGPKVQKGDTVTITYDLASDTGTAVDSVKKPYTFKVGDGKVIQGMDAGVVGMKKGGTRVISIPQAYGPPPSPMAEHEMITAYKCTVKLLSIKK